MELASAPLNSYQISSGGYNGPLDVVIELIEKNKLHISDLALASITDEFISYVRNQHTFPVEMISEFVAVAATLILIKSKSLLPQLELTHEEEQDIDEFKRRLMLYEKTCETARMLKKVFGATPLFARAPAERTPYFSPSNDLSTETVIQSLSRILSQVEKEEELPEARVRTTITIEEMMESLMLRVTRAMNMSFKEFSKGSSERVEIIVSFLALLELMKDGKLSADQTEPFGDILMKSESTGVPHYG